MRLPATFRAPRRSPLLQLAKSAVATVVAWLVAASLVPGPLPIFAAIAALLVVQPSLNQSFAKAVERTVGVIVGVAVAALLGLVLGATTWAILLSIVAALVLAWVLRMTPGTGNQVAISAMLVLALGTATPGYAIDRILETLIGAVIGFIVNVAIVPPVAVAPARRAALLLGEEVAAALDRLAEALGLPTSAGQREELLLQARLMRPMKDAADTALAAATESLTLNPRGRTHRAEIAALHTLVDRFGPIMIQVIGMTRAYRDLYEEALDREPTLTAIGEQLRRAAHDVRRMLPDAPAGAPADAAPSAAEPPALTTPLVVRAPAADHWILVGSMLVDLGRIHQTLGEE